MGRVVLKLYQASLDLKYVPRLQYVTNNKNRGDRRRKTPREFDLCQLKGIRRLGVMCEVDAVQRVAKILGEFGSVLTEFEWPVFPVGPQNSHFGAAAPGNRRVGTPRTTSRSLVRSVNPAISKN